MYDVKLIDYKVNSKFTFKDLSSKNGILKVANEIPEGIMVMRASAAWDQGYTGQSVVVAVLDTGCDSTHPDLKNKIIGGKNFTTEGNGENDYSDRHSHGTHVAGTIAAVRDNSGVVGVSPDVKLLILKVLNGDGDGYSTDITTAINYASNWVGPNGEKVKIISMSLGSKFPYVPMEDAVKNAVKKDILVVAAAGNSGDGNSKTAERSYPAYYQDVICVGAYDMWGKVAYFSNTNDNIDVVAPGVDVYSTIPGGYASYSGTSMAAPHISGALALIINYTKKRYNRDLKEIELYNELLKHVGLLDDVTKEEQGNGLVILNFENVPAVPDTISINDITLEEALKAFQERGVINTPDYWLNNAVAGKTVRGDYAALFIKRLHAVYNLNKKPIE
ncbi:Major intracellular serine protease precursor [compost metagenome]